MKKLSILLVMLFALQGFAQLPSNDNPRTGLISGVILDANSDTPLPYVSIVIKSNNDETITGGVTDEKGHFEINKIPEGKFSVEIQFIGFKKVKQEFELSRSYNKIDLGIIKLIEETNSLEEVTIVAETSTVLQKIDRKVITVGKDLIGSGATAGELLNNVQSVSVDSQSGNLSLRGNENVRVLVDGKYTNIPTAQLLKQIPSTSIKSVELITNPSAKYNPEGMSGIINIVLHKNATIGFNGSVNTGATFTERNSYNGSLDMNLRKGKVNVFANIGFNANADTNEGNISREDNNSNQHIAMENDGDSQLYKFGLDYYLNDKNTLSVYAIQNNFDGTFNAKTEVIYNNGNFDNILQDFTPESSNKSITYNLNYKIEFDQPEHNLELEVDYSDNESDENTFYENYIGNNPVATYNEIVKGERDATTVNLDYVNPLTDNTKLELGYELRIIDTKNDFISDLFPNSEFTYNRDIHSFYGSYSQKFDKLTMQLGARLESYKVFAEDLGETVYEDDYFTVYPSAFFTFNPSEKNQYQVSYSRRVDRPNMQQVNPIREWSTPTISSFGNPELDPQFTNSLEFNYTKQFKAGSFTGGVFFRNINDNLTRILYPDPTDPNKVILSFANTDNNNSYGLELSTNIKATEWWRLNASVDLYHQKDKGVIGTENLEVDNNAFNARINNNFKVSNNFRMILFAMYRGANKSIQWNAKEMWKMDLGASLNVFDGNGTISARFNDVFNTMSFGFETDRPYPQSGEFFWNSQNVYIGFNYRFGGGKNKARTRKNRDNNEARSGGFI